MNQHKQPSNLHVGRGWLNRAAEMLDACEDHVSDAEFATAAAAIGSGFVHLALAELSTSSMAETSQVRQAILTMSDEPETTLVEAIEREKRAAAEARPPHVTIAGQLSCPVCNPQAEAQPHDDEPTVVYVVEGEETGVHHVASTEELAKAWIADADHGAYLVISEMAVDRG